MNNTGSRIIRNYIVKAANYNQGAHRRQRRSPDNSMADHQYLPEQEKVLTQVLVGCSDHSAGIAGLFG